MAEEVLDKQKFIDYIEGHLSFEEKTKVDTYLEENPLERLALEASMEYNEKEPITAVLDRLEEKIDKKNNQAISPQINPEANVISLKRWLSIAASILLLCVAGYFLLENGATGNEQLFAQYFDLYPDNITEIKRGSENKNEQLILGIAHYEKGEFDEAINAFSPYAGIPKVQFFIAICELGRGQTEKSLLIFSKLEQNKEITDMQDGLVWYNALALLKDNQTTAAKEILENIIATDHYKKAAAIKLLEEL